MAGEAKTTNFMLGTATVLLGGMSQVWALRAPNYNIGMVKNFTITQEPSYTELQQGTRNTIVHSMMTQMRVSASMEIFEYNAQNITYALGLNGFPLAPVTDVATLSVAAVTSATIFTVGSSILTNFNVGDWVLFRDPTDENRSMIRQISAIQKVTAPYTITVATSLPTAYTLGSTISKMNNVSIGSKEEPVFLAARVMGFLADNTRIDILMPKIRITKGFNMAFASDNYASMPFEFQLYDLLPSDTYYNDFNGRQALLFTGA